MTGRAGHLSVGSLQSKRGIMIMIKGHTGPGLRGVAGRACCKSPGKLTAVGICMAGLTPMLLPAEHPELERIQPGGYREAGEQGKGVRRGFSMTLDTGHGAVCPFQREPCGVMIADGEAWKPKRLFGMATITPCRTKLPQMHIRVAPGTRSGGGPERLSSRVALRTGHLCVSPAKREGGEVMIKFPLMYPPSPGCVTGTAGFAHILPVGTGMAAIATIKGNMCKLHPALHHFVTLSAGHRTVLSRQRETGPVMAKLFRCMPVFFGMTAGAGAISKLPAVGVFVTRDTGGTQSQKGPIQIFVGFDQRLWFRNHGGTMALPTILNFCVFAAERIAGQGMVKGSPSTVPPPDQRRTASLMFHMAAFTPTEVRLRMEPLPGLNSGLKHRMTTQAFVGVHTLAGRMTADALLRSLKVCVNLMQWPRGQLGIPLPGPSDPQQQDPDQETAFHHPYPVHRATTTCTTMNRYITAAKGL